MEWNVTHLDLLDPCLTITSSLLTTQKFDSADHKDRFWFFGIRLSSEVKEHTLPRNELLCQLLGGA